MDSILNSESSDSMRVILVQAASYIQCSVDHCIALQTCYRGRKCEGRGELWLNSPLSPLSLFGCPLFIIQGEALTRGLVICSRVWSFVYESLLT